MTTDATPGDSPRNHETQETPSPEQSHDRPADQQESAAPLPAPPAGSIAVAQQTTGRRLIAIACLVWVVVYTLDLVGRDFWSENEARYALGAASVLRGEWLLPRIAGDIYADKPPLFFWFVALVSAPVGHVAEWTTRLANLLVTFLTMAAIFYFGGRTRNRWVGLLAAILLATSYEFWEQATRPGVDMLFTAMLTVAWIPLYLILSDRFTWARWAALWGFLGLAFLTKGPLALILSGLVAVVFAWWQFGRRDGWRRLLSLRPFVGVPLACLPFGLWALAVLVTHGIEPMWVVVVKHNFVRFFEAFDHAKPWYYLIGEMPVSMLPWTVLFPFVLWRLKQTWRERSTADRQSLAYASTIVLVVLGFFSLSSSKRDYYLLPLMPWFTYLIGAWIWETICAAASAKVACDDRELLRRIRATRFGRVFAGGLILTLIGMAIFSGIVTHFVNPRKTWRPVAEAIDASVDGDDHLAIVDNDTLRIFFYLKSPYSLYDDTTEDLDKLLALMNDGQNLDMVVEEDDLKHMVHFADIPLYIERVVPSRRDRFFILTNEARAGLRRYIGDPDPV